MSLSLTFSPCPNDTFVFHAWVHGRVEGAPAVDVDYYDVDVANGMAERGERDVIKVSYAQLPWLLDDYSLLPCGGAVGRGCGPLVVVRDRTDLDGARVAVPGERTTAYLLFRMWAETANVQSIDVVPFAEIMPAVAAGTYDAGLVIHEARFTYMNFGLSVLTDLGEWWESDTGLPIPLGAIVARRSLDREHVTDVVRASVDYAWAHPDESAAYVAEHAAEMDPDVMRRHIALYVNDFTADLGATGYAAVDGLLTRAADLGLVPAVEPAALRG
jgi:5,8-dihydroxy-2-naphthoate synthase